jgi:hypothetical protein
MKAGCHYYGGCVMRNGCAPLMVSGVIFTVFGLAHIARLFYHWSIVIAGVIIPETVSTIAVVIAFILAIWMFSAACCRKKK